MNHAQKPVEGVVKADFSHVPTPPEGAEGEAREAPAAPAPEETALLEFLDPLAMMTQVDFKHPFRHPQTGEAVTHAVVRRLTFAQVLHIQRTAPKDSDGAIDLLEFYAAMTGLSAAVIRGMEASDSKRLREAAYDFLPLETAPEAQPSASS